MFEPKSDRPQWQVIYEHLAAMKIGEVVTDEDLAVLLPDAPEPSIKSAFHRAMRQIEDDHSRTFARVRNVGYRMVEAAEHERLARVQHKRAGSRLKAAWRKAHSADRTQLSREERLRLDAIELNLAQQREMTARLEAKVRAEIRDRKAGEARLSERVDRLAELLERHGIADGDPHGAVDLIDQGSGEPVRREP